MVAFLPMCAKRSTLLTDMPNRVVLGIVGGAALGLIVFALALSQGMFDSYSAGGKVALAVGGAVFGAVVVPARDALTREAFRKGQDMRSKNGSAN